MPIIEDPRLRGGKTWCHIVLSLKTRASHKGVTENEDQLADRRNGSKWYSEIVRPISDDRTDGSLMALAGTTEYRFRLESRGMSWLEIRSGFSRCVLVALRDRRLCVRKG